MQRVAFIMHVKEGEEEEYIRRHQEVWPEELEEMKRAGIHKMSIFMRERELFLYMEVQDYAEATRLLDESPTSLRWEEYMAPIMEDETGSDYDAENAYPEGLSEVFFWSAE